MPKLFMPITHKNVLAGYLASGFGLDMSQISTEDGEAVAISIYNNKRSFSVHVGVEFVGNVHCMSGGRYVGLDLDKNEVCTYVGSDAEVKCFVDVLINFRGKSVNNHLDEYVSAGYPARWSVASSTGYPD